MAELVEYKTEYGTYFVTPDDYRLLCEDMARFGTIVVHTTAEGDRAIGTRLDPAGLHAAELTANKGEF